MTNKIEKMDDLSVASLLLINRLFQRRYYIQMLELFRKLIVYYVLFFFMLSSMISLGMLKNDLVLGFLFLFGSGFGIWVSIRSIRYKEMPSDIYETAIKKAKKYLDKPIEIEEYCKSANTNRVSVLNEISKGRKKAYGYRGYTFVERDI